MCAGWAIVASDTQPLREAIVDGQTGLLVPFFDPAALAAVQRIPVPSQMIARHELADDQTLKWLYPPPDSDTHYPEVPQNLVQELAGRLIERLQAK